MELAARPIPRARELARTLRFDRRALGAFTLGFAPVVYLALRGGGYDTIVYSETGLAVWWVVLLGALTGVLPLSRFGRLAWVSIALLSAFALWTAIASGWSSSAEQTIAQLGRVATYLGFFVLGLCVIRRDTVRALATGMAAAFGIVSLLAVLSRLYPGAFPANAVVQFFPGSNSRLNYPLNYADGTGNFLAMGLPLLLMIATRSRWLAGQALGAAAVPVAVLGVVMTASRGSIVAAVIAIAAFYALAPDRLPKLASGLAIGAGSAILIEGLLHRGGVRNGLSTPAAISQRHELMLLVVVVCIGVALVQVAIGLAARYAIRPRSLRIGRARATQATVAGALLVVVIAIAAGVPGKLKHDWNVFKETDTTGVVQGNVLSRLGTVAGSHRYQYWQAAANAFDSKPLIGIGPGTYQYYWAQHGSFHEYILNAHSLYLETLAETGLIGFALLAGFLLTLLGVGVWRALRAPPLARAGLAAATASLIAFLASAGYDWMWQLPAAPIAALLLGAAIVAYRSPERPSGARSEPALTEAGRSGQIKRDWPLRAVLGGLAVAAMIAIAIPFGMTSAIRSSQAAAGAGNLKSALSDALTAQRLEPDAATPRLQQALVLEQAHEFRLARVAIAQAASREPTNWSIWLVRSRIDAESGHALAAVRDYRRAHALDPLSPATAE